MNSDDIGEEIAHIQQDSQTDTSSSLKLQYYYKLLKHKGWVAVFTVSSYVLYLSSNSGSGNIGFRYYVLTPFLQAMSFIGISLLCVLYGKHIWLFRILRVILALYFGVFGLIILLGSLQRLITYIIGG